MEIAATCLFNMVSVLLNRMVCLFLRSMKAMLIRTHYAPDYTQGILLVFDNELNLKFQCCTLELPWRNNMRQVSCIPEGTYQVVRRNNAKFKDHYHVLQVPGRDFILIHPGNYTSQILGCILPGSEFKRLNADSIPDIIQSQATLTSLLKLMGDGFELQITHPELAK
jgi:hypothetical protein